MVVEAKLHLYIHPAIQVLGIVFGYITLYWGTKRLLSKHFGKRLTFPWKSHVLFGRIAICLWLVGLGVGLLVTRSEWNYMHITNEHYVIGMLILPFLLVTFLTGYWMELIREKRRYLCLLHAFLGMILCLLVFVQIFTGIEVFTMLVW